MSEILRIFQEYCGSGWYPVLFLAALLYLLVTEKNRTIRLVLVESSLVLVVLFFLPPFKALMDVLDEGTYYRVLWLWPMTVGIAYAGIKCFGRHPRTGFAILAAVLILTGQYTYKNVNITRAQNRFHIPNAVVAICNEMMPAEDEERVWAVFPDELIHYVRQYSSEIQMPYGREMLVPEWTWNWDTHPIYRIMRVQPVDLDALAPLLTEYNCHYLVLNRAVPTTGSPEENGLVKIAGIEAYDVYRNESVPIFKKQN